MKKALIIIGIIVLLAIIGGAFLWMQKSQTPVTDVQNSNTETADWKTYKSDIYDYEIKYPSKYKVSGIIVWTGVPNIDKIEYQGTDYTSSLEIFARNQDFIMRDCLTYSGAKDIIETREINGNKFYVVYEKKEWVGLGGYVAKGSATSEYRIIHNDYCYIIVQTDLANKDFETLEKILSTFKFTK